VLAPYLNRIVYVKQENSARREHETTPFGTLAASMSPSSTAMTLGCPITWLRRCSCLTTTRARAYVLQWPRRRAGQEREFMKGCPSAGEATFGSLLVERCQIPISTVVARKEAIVRAECSMIARPL